MEYVNTYKYLGEMFNHKGNAEEHIIQQKKENRSCIPNNTNDNGKSTFQQH